MATSIYLLQTMNMGTVQAVRYAATADNAAFWIGSTTFPSADDAQTDLNSNADSLLATAQSNNPQAPFALIDGTKTGNTKIATVTGYPFNPYCPTGVQAVCIDVSGFTSAPTLSIGVNSPNYSDILVATPLTGMNAIRKMVNLPLYTSSVGSAAGGTVDVFARVTIAAVATRYLVLVKPIGSLFL